jgi:Zn-dependent protease with chaperone function
MKFSPNDFIHPEDKAAQAQLEAIPGFRPAVKMLMKVGVEQYCHGTFMAHKIRLGPKQLPALYALLPPICTELGITEPEFYLEMNPLPNAYTLGDTRTMVVMTSALAEYLEGDELRGVIAHECGHIVCRHMLYQTMTQVLLMCGQALGLLSAISMPVQLGLLYWSRRSELSADRAAAVVMGGAQPVIETMIRLSGGPKALTKDVDLDLYMQQAAAYDQLQESTWDKLLQGLATMYLSHPFPAVRSREIHHWCEGEAFRRLMQAARAQPGEATLCPGCQQPVQGHWKFCGHCGAANPNNQPTPPTT